MAGCKSSQEQKGGVSAHHSVEAYAKCKNAALLASEKQWSTEWKEIFLRNMAQQETDVFQ